MKKSLNELTRSDSRDLHVSMTRESQKQSSVAGSSSSIVEYLKVPPCQGMRILPRNKVMRPRIVTAQDFLRIHGYNWAHTRTTVSSISLKCEQSVTVTGELNFVLAMTASMWSSQQSPGEIVFLPRSSSHGSPFLLGCPGYSLFSRRPDGGPSCI